MTPTYETIVQDILNAANKASEGQQYIPAEYRELINAIKKGPLAERLRYECRAPFATLVFLEPAV